MSERIIAIICLILCVGLIVLCGVKVPTKAELSESNKKYTELKQYVDNKLSSNKVYTRIDRLEQINKGQALLITQLQAQVYDLAKIPVVEKLETVDSINERLTKVEQQLDNLKVFEEAANAVLRIQDFDINNLRTEIETLKTQIAALAKKEHSVLVKKIYYRRGLFCR